MYHQRVHAQRRTHVRPSGQLTMLSFLAVMVSSQVSVGQSTEAIDFKKMAPLVVEVVDDQGKPIDHHYGVQLLC